MVSLVSGMKPRSLLKNLLNMINLKLPSLKIMPSLKLFWCMRKQVSDYKQTRIQLTQFHLWVIYILYTLFKSYIFIILKIYMCLSNWNQIIYFLNSNPKIIVSISVAVMLWISEMHKSCKPISLKEKPRMSFYVFLKTKTLIWFFLKTKIFILNFNGKLYLIIEFKKKKNIENLIFTFNENPYFFTLNLYWRGQSTEIFFELSHSRI